MLNDSVANRAGYQALAEFRYRLRLFLRFSEEAAAKEDLSPQQHQALLSIHGFPDGPDKISIGELAEKLQLRHHSVVGLINRLQKDGLVIRRPSETDRRFVRVSLTEKGLGKLRRLSEVHQRELQQRSSSLRELLKQISTGEAHL